jgi:class 3 adenylate cyclase
MALQRLGRSGPVVISECGDSRRQIAYFGDTVNVTLGSRSIARRSAVLCWSQPIS